MRLPIAPLVLAACAASSFSIVGCLDRPMVAIESQTTRLSITKLRVRPADKVDLLLVVDNSWSMADKQTELGRRIPELVSALTTPYVDPETGRTTRVVDMHVGVITSSLGSHGTWMCHPKKVSRGGEHNDDKAHLLPRPSEGTGSGYKVDASGNPVAAACPDPKARAPMTWVHDAKVDPNARFVGSSGASDLQAAVSCAVQSAKDDGCGFEATWESIHRFLVDPSPYVTAETKCVGDGANEVCTGPIQAVGKDEQLLAQRKAFLRDDSLLAVIVLSDENDFSLKPVADHWRPWSVAPRAMFRGWSACANVPDDFEPDDALGHQLLATKYGCKSCAQDASDPACKGWPSPTPPSGLDIDTWDLRGFHQVQRFGRNFLWGRDRYVKAFTEGKVVGLDGRTYPNPIFAGGARTKDMVLVAGIVGVPNQLVSDKDGKPKKLDEADWEKLVSPDLSKRDPHMIETWEPRTKWGIPTFSGDRNVDPVHGGDRAIPGANDLQYACIAKRSTSTGGTDCDGSSPNPLCDAPGVQPYFKAYPGLRHLRILRELGPSGVVASICNDSFRPAIAGITERIKVAIDGQCIFSSLSVDASGEAQCLLVESFEDATYEGKGTCEALGKGYCTPGAAPCREEGTDYPPVSPEVAASQLTLPITVKTAAGMETKPVRASVEGGNVYAVGEDGKKHLLCEVMQLAGGRVPASETQSCLSDPKWTPSSGGGWCFSQDPKVVGDRCRAAGATGRMRFLGATEPKRGSEVFTLCIGK